MFVAHSPWAYIGPDVILPFASVIASIVGVVLIFWRFIVKWVKKAFRSIFRGTGGAGPVIRADTAPAVSARVELNASVPLEQVSSQTPLSDVAKP